MRNVAIALVVGVLVGLLIGQVPSCTNRDKFDPNGMYMDTYVHVGQEVRVANHWWRVKRAGQSELRHGPLGYGYYAQWVELELSD